MLPTSEAEADTHLTVQEELTDTNTKEIESIKVGSNKICIREDLAKEKMCSAKNPAVPFSKWAMWNSLN